MKPRWPSRRLLSGALFLVLAAIVMWFAVFLSVGDGDRLLGYVNAAGFWMSVAAAMCGVAFLCLGRHLAGIGGLVLALCILVPAHRLTVSNVARERQGPIFRVITASLRNLNNNMEAAATNLLDDKPHILVVQEADLDSFSTALLRRDPRWKIVTNNQNDLIACRCQFRNSGVTAHILWADVPLPAGTIRIWNIHAPKSYNRPTINRLFFADLAEQVRSYPSGIVAGDFNATPWNDGYRIIAKVASDSWPKVRWDPGFTFPTKARRLGVLSSLIKIDHIFVTGKLVPVSATLLDASPGADHYPVRVDLAWSG